MKTFIAVVEAGSFVKADDAENLSKPAVSRLVEFLSRALSQRDWGQIAGAATVFVQSTPEMRHVNGGQLCAGLRDFAILRYGLLSRTVLNSWNINTTEDFGRIVFSLIDLGMLRRNDDDCVEDFIDVYSFNESFADLAALAAHGD